VAGLGVVVDDAHLGVVRVERQKCRRVLAFDAPAQGFGVEAGACRGAHGDLLDQGPRPEQERAARASPLRLLRRGGLGKRRQTIRLTGEGPGRPCPGGPPTVAEGMISTRRIVAAVGLAVGVTGLVAPMANAADAPAFKDGKVSPVALLDSLAVSEIPAEHQARSRGSPPSSAR
jgi:hypothetical protein